MSEKYAMGSPQWLAALHAFMVAARPGMTLSADFTMCEVYRNVPPTVSGGAETVAFTTRFRKDSPEVEFELKEASDATFKLTIDYATVVPIGRLIVGGDPEKQAGLQRAIGAAIRSGKATLEGAPPDDLANLPVHDQIARITA